ncbi:MAG TPA: amidohydrolase family protein [Roseiflexaceae bacterium]|nr:amidohydrolase family protein [Roseiflexaceae bacterium]
MTAILAQEQTRPATHTAVIDCDIHNTMPSHETLARYLPERWRRQLAGYGLRFYALGAYYPRLNPNAARTDAWPPGGIPGSDLEFMREQLLDAWGIEYGILNPLYLAGEQPNPAYSEALAQGLNEWQIAEWLEPEPRLRASLVVPYEDGQLAAAEIDRHGADPRFVQVLLVARTREPLGRRKYWPMYEAAVRHDLPIGIHFGGAGGWPITGAGWPSFYIEDHCGMPQAFQAQIISLVCEGVFEQFPTLKIVLIEGGFAWLPPLMWRLDRSWRRLREEVPHLRRAPSEYIREHFWLTTQPIEEPSKPAYFEQLLEQLDMNDRLMFATDYPHWDFDAPDLAIPANLRATLRRNIMAENARRFYRL